jgi:hypothetical protein
VTRIGAVEEFVNASDIEEVAPDAPAPPLILATIGRFQTNVLPEISDVIVALSVAPLQIAEGPPVTPATGV